MAKAMTEKADMKADKKVGIKEGGKKDKALDVKKGAKMPPFMKGSKK